MIGKNLHEMIQVYYAFWSGLVRWQPINLISMMLNVQL